jgi:heat shock protein HslJ
MKKYRFFEVLALITILSLTVLAGVSCSKAQSNGSKELSGITWILKSYGDAANTTKTIAGHEPTLTFDKEKMEIGGSGGVNSYGGTYAVDGSKLTTSQIVQTLMASTNEALNDQENTFFKILRSAASFKIEAGQLTVTGTDGTLVFSQK